MKESPTIEWCCTSQGCRRGSRLLPTALLCAGRLPRLRRETWLRLRHPLEQLPPATITLTRIDAALMEELRRHPERDEPQVRSAFRFWQAGFGDGYAWMDNGEPLCLIWLVTTQHQAARPALGTWAGMYPPLPEGVAMAEGIYTFRRGLRRPGGAATATAFALFHVARRAGWNELRTHIHTSNLAALRWAERVGWMPCGRIHRCAFDVRWLRDHPFFLHERTPPPAPGAREAEPRSAVTTR